MSDYTQPDLFAAKTAGAAGMELAARAAGQDWMAQAKVALHQCCLTHVVFFCDDVWAMGLESCGHDRAFGAVMQYGIRMGWMQSTGRLRASVRSHGSGKPEYESLIYEGEA